MSAPVVFTDLYKPVKDFFSKGYNAQSIRFEGKAKGGDATLLSTFEQTTTGITTSAEYEQLVSVASVPAIGKLVVNSNGRFQPSLKFKNPASLKGLTVSLAADQPTSGEKGKSDYLETVAEYVQPSFFAKTAVRPLEQTVDTSLTVAANKFLVGGSVKANPKGLAGYTVGASFKSPAIFFAGTYGVAGSAATTTLGAIYAYKKHLFGAQVGLGKATTYDLGWESKCGDTTLKAKINNKQAVAVSAQHKISRIVATLSGEVDVNKANVSKVGVKFLLEE